MEVGRVDPGRLVFVDEMGTHTSLAPLHAYAPIGERAFFEVPRNRGKNTTLLRSLQSEGMGPSMALEGRPRLASSKPTWSTCWLPLSGRVGCGNEQPRSPQAQEGKAVDRR